jgi:hypothetical protein
MLLSHPNGEVLSTEKCHEKQAANSAYSQAASSKQPGSVTELASLKIAGNNTTGLS